MNTSIRKLLTWAPFLLILCASFSSFGQSNFNLTVTESTTGPCKPCLPEIELSGGSSGGNCLDDSVPLLGLVQVDFHVVLNIENNITPQSGFLFSHPFRLKGKVEQAVYYNPSWVPAQLYAPLQGGGYMPISNAYSNIFYTGASREPLSFDMTFYFQNQGSCDYNFSFYLIDWASGDTFDPIEIEVQRCNCGSGNSNKVASSGLSSLHIFPNPVTGESMLIESSWTGKAASTEIPAQINIFNLQGQKVMTEEAGAFDPMGKLSKKLNVSDLAPGMYVLEVKAGSYRETRKIMIE